MPRDLDLDLGSGHMAYRRASVIDLYLAYVQISLESEKLFYGRTDGRTNVRTDRHRGRLYDSEEST